MPAFSIFLKFKDLKKNVNGFGKLFPDSFPELRTQAGLISDHYFRITKSPMSDSK